MNPKLAWTGALLALALTACRSHSTAAGSPAELAQPEWSYAGRTGPDHWGDLAPAYALARSGKEQSPIDIVTAPVPIREAPALVVSYAPTSLEILNNGHTVEDEYHGGGTLTVGGHEYRLAQFHFHAPSEHTLDGRHAALEIHLVHKDASGKLAVIGVLVHEGRSHAELAKLAEHLPAKRGRTEAVEGLMIDPTRLLPASLASYRYAGSLTTPPCSEGVSWFVLQQPIEAAAGELAAFRNVLHGNNRPTQPLHAREVVGAR